MSSEKPFILVSNDDGIYSNGIKALAEVAAEFGEVMIVAPDRQQSAVGHAVTIETPLRANATKVAGKFDGLAVNGTPADCVKLAHDQLLKGRKPDLVLSGVNHGSNAGINILYSGTVSAATEGTVLGYPSIAVSCTDYDESADLTGTMEAARRVIKFVLDNKPPKGVTFNVNAPSGDYKGIKWARMADSRYVEEYEARKDPFNRPYYWLTGKFELLDDSNDADIYLLNQGYAAVTPIQYDLTDYSLLKDIAEKEL
ncbi:MAG TPA: 5'/3'-nucleotidase SurE [Balneolaceae bacterium]|nr:5'/3'-nucleotidase SurE [Balneolaceae bacterium]|tara:strand:- start:105556 stop:106320 length:765 start_codon:yes stop_codon:yes gene_type:complete